MVRWFLGQVLEAQQVCIFTGPNELPKPSEVERHDTKDQGVGCLHTLIVELVHGLLDEVSSLNVPVEEWVLDGPQHGERLVLELLSVERDWPSERL